MAEMPPSSAREGIFSRQREKKIMFRERLNRLLEITWYSISIGLKSFFHIPTKSPTPLSPILPNYAAGPHPYHAEQPHDKPIIAAAR